MTHAHCDDCLPPTLQVDPLTIWENIPCPPDDMQDFLFSPELVHKLGPESGISIIVNIAKRCDIEVPTLFPTIGHVTGSWMFDTCGIYCVTTTIVICLSILLVMVLVVTAGFLRKECGWFRWSRDKYVIEHISTIISEDGNLSEYKFSTARSHADTLSKIDDELSSIYVARWFKIFVGEKCPESQHSIHTSLPNSQCICKRLAEHIYEDINSCKDSNEISEDLSSSYRKYSCSDEDIVLINHSGNERESVEEMNSINDSTFVSNDYEPLNRSGNYNDANGANDQNQSASHSRLNDSPIDMHLHATDMEDNDCDTILANPLLITNNYERLNSDNSAHSRTPLIHNDSSDSEELHVYVPILS